jgi:hypothetical protein
MNGSAPQPSPQLSEFVALSSALTSAATAADPCFVLRFLRGLQPVNRLTCTSGLHVAFMLVFIMFQSTQLILDGDEAQTVVARLSTDAGKIPGAFGVDRSVVRETLEAIFHELYFADVADRVLNHQLGLRFRLTRSSLTCFLLT